MEANLVVRMLGYVILKLFLSDGTAQLTFNVQLLVHGGVFAVGLIPFCCHQRKGVLPQEESGYVVWSTSQSYLFILKVLRVAGLLVGLAE
jgi:hypothetical protein